MSTTAVEGAFVVVVALGLALLVAGAAISVLGMRWLWRSVVLRVQSVGTDWRWLSVRPVLDPRRRSTLLIRRDLWRAVAGSERAVGHLRAAGAPLGDLPSLVRRLRSAATDLDRSLQIAQDSASATGTTEALSRDLGLLRSAAEHIQRSAAIALGASASPAVGALVDDTRRELAAFSAAISRAVMPSPTR